jgi:hypothetical protein
MVRYFFKPLAIDPARVIPARLDNYLPPVKSHSEELALDLWLTRNF